MSEVDRRLVDLPHDRQIVDARAELSEADLECVVGGLARPWTEADADDWLDPAPGLL